MFGNNPIRSINRDPMRLAVESIFYTIQGEGPYSGRPALFIRMAGCNLACYFCDTQFEGRADIKENWLDVAHQVVVRPLAQRRFVVITGGEPMLQNTLHLVDFLLNSGTELIQIETAGTVWQQELTPFVEEGSVVLVCSPKTPGIHPEVQRLCKHWKYIIMDAPVASADGLPGIGTQVSTRHSFQKLYRPPAMNLVDYTIWLSPCDEQDPVKNARNLEIAVHSCLVHGYRLSLQIHKIAGLP